MAHISCLGVSEHMVCKITHCSTSPTMGKNSKASRGEKGSINSIFGSASNTVIFPNFSENGINRKINPVCQILKEHQALEGRLVLGRIAILPASFRKPAVHHGTDVLMHDAIINRRGKGIQTQTESKALCYVSIHAWDIYTSLLPPQGNQPVYFPKAQIHFKCCSLCLQHSVTMCIFSYLHWRQPSRQCTTG